MSICFEKNQHRLQISIKVIAFSYHGVNGVMIGTDVSNTLNGDFCVSCTIECHESKRYNIRETKQKVVL